MRWNQAGRLPHGNRSVCHAKVACHWSLAAIYAILRGFWSRQSGKDSYLEYTIYSFDRFRQGLNFPHSVLPTSVLPCSDIAR